MTVPIRRDAVTPREDEARVRRQAPTSCAVSESTRRTDADRSIRDRKDRGADNEGRSQVVATSTDAVVDAIGERADHLAEQAVEHATMRLSDRDELTAAQADAIEELAHSIATALVTERVEWFVAQESHGDGASGDGTVDLETSSALDRLFVTDPEARPSEDDP